MKNLDDIKKVIKGLNSEAHKLIPLGNKTFAASFFTFEIKKGKLEIKGVYRAGLLAYLNSNGFAQKKVDKSFLLVRESLTGIIDRISLPDIKQFIREKFETNAGIKIQTKSGRLEFSHEVIRETWLKNEFLINSHFMENLNINQKPMLRDTQEFAYFFFENKILKVSKQGIELIDYSNLTNYSIWRSQLIKRNFYFDPNYLKCEFSKFISNVSENDLKVTPTFKSAIGYMLHNFNSESTNFAVICYDAGVYRKNVSNGGKGKGIFCKSLGYFRKQNWIDGKKFSENDKFCWQEITPETQIICLDDMKQYFEFERLNSVLTEGFQIEKKTILSFHIAHSTSPKVIITTNSPLQAKGITASRRQFVLEFSSFYSDLILKGERSPITSIHGAEFFTGWSEKEWNLFDNFMIQCVLDYFKNGLIFSKSKQPEINQFISQRGFDLYDFLESKNLNQNMELKTKLIYDSYKFVFPESIIKQKGFTSILMDYLGLLNVNYRYNCSNGKSSLIIQKQETTK